MAFVAGMVCCKTMAQPTAMRVAEFGTAQWIAMDADSTILFPHVHLLKAKSEQGQSLKQYRLPVLSKTVMLKRKKVRRAWVDICGLGQYELFIGGRKQGDDLLSPGWTMYSRRLLYNEIDVTETIKNLQSSNLSPQTSIDVMLGGGM